MQVESNQISARVEEKRPKIKGIKEETLHVSKSRTDDEGGIV